MDLVIMKTFFILYLKMNTRAEMIIKLIYKFTFLVHPFLALHLELELSINPSQYTL